MRRGLSRSTTAETPHKNPQETTTTTKRKFGFGGGSPHPKVALSRETARFTQTQF